MAAHEFRRAKTSVIGHLIDARAVIPAQVGQAIIPVHLTAFAFSIKTKQKQNES